jgi:hypothetical protein
LRSAGIRGALCVPVEVLGGPIGTLDLFTATPRAWDDSEVAAAHAYAGVVASLLGSAVAAHASSRLANQLQTALDSRVLIEQAKGVLMASEKVDAQTAFTRLRRQARNTSRPLPEVAREIIDGVWGSPTYRRPARPGRGNKVAQKHERPPTREKPRAAWVVPAARRTDLEPGTSSRRGRTTPSEGRGPGRFGAAVVRPS